MGHPPAPGRPPAPVIPAPPPLAAAGSRRRARLPRIAPDWRRRVAIVLAVVGLLLLAEGAVTLVWKEPFTGYLAAQAQDDLTKQLDRLTHRPAALAATDRRSLAAIPDVSARLRKRMSLLAAQLDRGVTEGEALGRIQIGRLGADYVFVQGIEDSSLRKGPGHYSGATKLPGEGGVVGIAGHRTTYEAPFRDVDKLQAGDRIVLAMPYGRFTYQVSGHRIVPADYAEAFTHGGGASGEALVLSACHPRYSATERILVDARLVASEPLGTAVEPSVPGVPAEPADSVAKHRTAARLKLLGERQLGPAMTGADVRELQRLLGMPETGAFDADTSAAVLAFQRDQGLPQVGVAGGQTKLALARRERPPAQPPTPADVPQRQSLPPAGTGR
jgi:sortase A